MNEYTKIYWITRLDAANSILISLLIISLIMVAFYYIGWLVAGCDEFRSEKKLEAKDRFRKFTVKIPTIFYPIIIISSLGIIFLPTKDDAIAIWAGGSTLEYVKKDTSLQKIPYQTTKLITDYLDSQLEKVKK